jgi:hypothetical protein
MQNANNGRKNRRNIESKDQRTRHRFHEIWNNMVGRDTAQKYKDECEMKDSRLKNCMHDRLLISKHGVVSAQKEDRPHPACHGVCPVSTARTKYTVHKTEHKFNPH